MDLNPRYWYKDENDNIQKYYYCKLCGAGPFKNLEEGDAFKFYGLRDKDPYCTPCARNHRYFMTPKCPAV